MGVNKTTDQIKIKIKISSQEPQASFKAQHQELKDTDVLNIFKINEESQNLDHWCFKGR